jgi:hypothetical protein
VATLRGWVGTAADLAEIGTFSVFLVALVLSVATDWFGQEVPVWALLLAILIGIAAVFITRLVSARGRQERPGEVDKLEQELEVGTTYLASITDFLALVRESADGRPPDRAIELLERSRTVVFLAVIQGTNSARGEVIRCAYWEPDPSNPSILVIKNHHGHAEARAQELRLRADHRSLAGLAFTEGQAIYAEDAASDPRVQKLEDGAEIGSLFCVPVYHFLGSRTEVVGVFSVAAYRVGAFTLADRRFIDVCAHILALVDFLIGAFEITKKLATKSAPLISIEQTVDDECDNDHP